MSQKRIQDYGSPIVAQSLKSLTDSITTAGILSGNEFVSESERRIRINPGACVTHQGVIIVEDEAKTLSMESNTSSAVDYTIYYLHEDVDISGGVAAELILESGLLTSDVVKGCILGYVRYPGGGIPLEQSHFIQPPPLTIGTVIPTRENANWIFPIKNQGYVVTQASGATLNLTDGGTETFTTISLTGSIVNGSKVIQSILPSTVNLLVGMVVTGSGITSGSTIVSIDTSNQITLSNAVTATLTGVALSAVSPKPYLYLKVRNNSLTTGSVTLTFPFKVGELPYALLQMILSTDNSALVTPLFIDSVGDVSAPLNTGFTGQSEFLLKSVSIPRTAVQTANSVVYLQLQISLAASKEARIQCLGLNTYNLPV
jgi:hypothetical protein